MNDNLKTQKVLIEFLTLLNERVFPRLAFEIAVDPSGGDVRIDLSGADATLLTEHSNELLNAIDHMATEALRAAPAHPIRLHWSLSSPECRNSAA